MTEFLKWIKGLPFGKESFNSKGCVVEVKDGNKVSKIYCRQPDGDQLLRWSYANLDLEKSEIKAMSEKQTDAEQLHRLTREKKFIPFAKETVYKLEGYEKNSFDFVEKYFPHHLETAMINVFRVDETSKKKPLA